MCDDLLDEHLLSTLEDDSKPSRLRGTVITVQLPDSNPRVGWSRPKTTPVIIATTGLIDDAYVFYDVLPIYSNDDFRKGMPGYTPDRMIMDIVPSSAPVAGPWAIPTRERLRLALCQRPFANGWRQFGSVGCLGQMFMNNADTAWRTRGSRISMEHLLPMVPLHGPSASLNMARA